MKDEMMKDNPAADKAFAFALRIVKLHRHLSEKKKEFVLSKQVLRSGTSIGANFGRKHRGTESVRFSGEDLNRIQGGVGNVLLAQAASGGKIHYG